VARRSDHSRAELTKLVVDAASDLIEVHGARNVTARMIAARIGYTAGTLYTHFANLEDIFLHVNGRSLEQLRATCEAAAGAATTALDALLEMGYAYLSFAESHPNRFELLFTQHIPPGEAVPAHLQSNIDTLFGLVETELKRLAPGTDEQTLDLGVRALWSGVHGIVGLSLADQLFTRHWRADRPIVRMLVTRFVAGWPPARGNPRGGSRHGLKT
jgi:AcrR family transcriptional regulator